MLQCVLHCVLQCVLQYVLQFVLQFVRCSVYVAVCALQYVCCVEQLGRQHSSPALV